MEQNNKTAGIIIGIVVAVVLVGGGLWLLNRNKDEDKTAKQESSQQMAAESATADKNIVVIASNTPTLSTLVTAVKAAALVDTLSSEGPFTVFAPTDDAFAALPAGTLDSLLKPENVDQLKSILTYHVVAGQVMASDLKDGQVITTVQGGTLTVKISDGKVQLIDAKGNAVTVEKADVDASNGVVHVINGVLLPS